VEFLLDVDSDYLVEMFQRGLERSDPALSQIFGHSSAELQKVKSYRRDNTGKAI